ncbi:hypothetical protein ACFU53_13295 [Streptomyces sp. NPDC057474]|uniref:hypothetical protein n=1 Tax=Streptomyces sp. NPDC057474 TaxID=3346144 RepID=UPI00367E76BC
MRVLSVGDRFISAGYYVDALAAVCGPRFGPVQADWPGNKAEQHDAQQTMEWHGPGAMAALGEIVVSVGDSEVPALHFAPVSWEVLRIAPQLRAVCAARAGRENVGIAAATARGVAVVPVSGRNATAAVGLAASSRCAVAVNAREPRWV